MNQALKSDGAIAESETENLTVPANGAGTVVVNV